MSMREAIRSVRERIKTLAVEQKKAKASRKGCSAERMPGLWEEVLVRSVEITACLNFHHALRGSAHRHKVQNEYWDKHFTEELTKKFAQTA